MTAKIKYSDEPIGNPRVIADFLPPPEGVAFREEGVKITLALSRKASSSLNAKPRSTTRSISA